MTLFTGITHSIGCEVNRVSPQGGISQSRIAGVASALPEYRYPQKAITAALKHHWNGSLARPELLDRLHTRAGVEYRHLAFPLEQYARFGNWGRDQRRVAPGCAGPGRTRDRWCARMR